MESRHIAWTLLLIAALAAPLVLAQTQGELTSVIKDIPGQIGAGKEVTIVGFYRGWDLLKETKQAPPVTRSDWVIADKSGAIYVQAKNVDIKGKDKLGGKDLMPNEKESVNHVLRVTGTVRVTAQKQAYIEPASIEVLK